MNLIGGSNFMFGRILKEMSDNDNELKLDKEKRNKKEKESIFNKISRSLKW